VARETVGLALAGGGPLGAIYEIGALVALDEALEGLELTNCGIYVGVSSGAFLSAGLASGFTPREMYKMFVENDTADDPFEPEILLRPAIGEYGRRLASLPGLFFSAIRGYLEAPFSRGFFESFQRLARATPTGIFDSTQIGGYLRALYERKGLTDDFRNLRCKLFLVATDLDTAVAVPFGAPGWDDVPISSAVQASSALPGLFPPVEISGRHYVDGALTKTLHASVALKEGAKLLLCINPIVPFNAEIARQEQGDEPISLVKGGLPTVLAQTFRSIVHTRLITGMSRYDSEFPDADVVLFEPSQGDTELFFTNVFSYAERERLSEHAYQTMRAQLLRRYDELTPVLQRHGLELNRDVLEDVSRTLSGRMSDATPSRRGELRLATSRLGRTLQRLETTLDLGQQSQRGAG
jgi:NTE family protein